MGNVFGDYIKRETERMARQPEMMKSNDYRYGHRFIIVKDEPKNIEKFNNLIKDANLPDDITIYYNEPYYYDLIEDGVHTRAKIKKERERQEMLNNPQVNLDINSKEELIEYLISEIINNEESMIWEYSTDFELDEVKLKAKEKELRRLSDKLL